MSKEQPRMSPGVKETLDALYEASGQRESRPDFLAKLFAPIPMEAELCAAGLAPQEARFIASQLARNGYALIKLDNYDTQALAGAAEALEQMATIGNPAPLAFSQAIRRVIEAAIHE